MQLEICKSMMVCNLQLLLVRAAAAAPSGGGGGGGGLATNLLLGRVIQEQLSDCMQIAGRHNNTFLAGTGCGLNL